MEVDKYRKVATYFSWSLFQQNSFCIIRKEMFS